MDNAFVCHQVEPGVPCIDVGGLCTCRFGKDKELVYPLRFITYIDRLGKKYACGPAMICDPQTWTYHPLPRRWYTVEVKVSYDSLEDLDG